MPRVSTASPTFVRWQARAPRIVATAAVAGLCLAGVRATLTPIDQHVAPAARATVSRDLEAETFAASFVREYLTWENIEPSTRERALRSFIGEALDSGAGVELKPHVRQRVVWTSVEGSTPDGRERAVTVAAGTTNGTLHVAVRVARDRGGLSISSYPALVGPPATNPRARVPERDEVEDRRLRAVARRVVTNYLARARENLAADLTGAGVVVLPPVALRVLTVEAVEWVRSPSRIAVTVRARGRDGVRLTLTYELTVVRRAGRWLVSGMPSTSSSKEVP